MADTSSSDSMCGLFSMLPVSLPVWNVLPKLRYLQFPWRWLLALEAPFAILFCGAAWFKPLRWRIPVLVLCAIAFAGLSAYAGKFWFQSCGAGQEAVAQAEEAGIGVYGKREYALPGARRLSRAMASRAHASSAIVKRFSA